MWQRFDVCQSSRVPTSMQLIVTVRISIFAYSWSEDFVFCYILLGILLEVIWEILSWPLRSFWATRRDNEILAFFLGFTRFNPFLLSTCILFCNLQWDTFSFIEFIFSAWKFQTFNPILLRLSPRYPSLLLPVSRAFLPQIPCIIAFLQIG